MFHYSIFKFSKSISGLQHYIIGQTQIGSDMNTNPKLMPRLEIGYSGVKIDAGLSGKKTALIGMFVQVNSA
jgi:hypothetical protein